jgi:glycosyltransferase involved in cell wall biosynthesis
VSLIVIDTRWIRSLNIDGIANFTLSLTRELLNTNTQNSYILLIHSSEVGEYLKKYISPDIEKFFYKVDFSVTSLKNIVKLPGIIKKIQPDIYFSPCYPFFSQLIKPYHIGVVHDLIPLIFPEMFRKASLKFKLFYCNRFVQKQSLKGLNQVVTVSESTKKDLGKYLGLQPEKIRVIVEGSNLKMISGDGNMSSPEINKKYFLFVGRHEKYKNIKTLINIYNQLPEQIKSKYSLFIVGKFNEIYTPELQEQVKKLQLEKRVNFFDSVMPEQLPAFYKKAKLLIHLSLYEGFGLTIIEAMSLAIPVIASNCSSIPEVVGDAGILVNPEDDGQVIESIIKMVEDDVLYKKLSDKSLERAKYFTWQKSAQQLLEIFHDLNGQNKKQ